MTTGDENHIIRTTGKRLGQGMIIIVGIMVFGGIFTTIYWTDLANTPPPVSTLPTEPVEFPPLSPENAPAEQTSGSPESSPAAASGTPLTILAGSATQGNPDYDPDALTVAKGDAIAVTNEDSVPHTVTSGEPGPEAGQLFDTSIIEGGASATIDTASLEPGEYPYHCMVHPYMTGTLTVQ